MWGPTNKLQTLLYLLRKSYALIYQLLLTSEPVSEALLPIYNQLTTLRKCLLEVKKLGGVSSPRELYPYSMKVRAPRHRNTVTPANSNIVKFHWQHASRRQVHGGRRDTWWPRSSDATSGGMLRARIRPEERRRRQQQLCWGYTVDRKAWASQHMICPHPSIGTVHVGVND